ncbi:MAG: orotate phosphoribosyltransferase [Bacteroidetes bacterium]|nr:MAG: orotate phosphoribosyltransferase [Bacteroidota bacterium]
MNINEPSIEIAKVLLQINAIKINLANYFTWASGLKAPIYCDNRKTLSYPEARNFIKSEFVNAIKKNFGKLDLIAGVATGAIAQGALVADYLGLPFVYVRSSPKKHGLENLIEGVTKKGQSVLVIEDLVSTGASSLKAVDALRKAGCNVLGMLAIFTYGFKIAEDNFKNADCKLITLSNYETLIAYAHKNNIVSDNDLVSLRKWRTDPENWVATI